MKRVFLIVLDSFGIGAMEDAASYGDVNVDTLGTVSSSPFFSMPNMEKLGLFQIDGVSVPGGREYHRAVIARLKERSKGKDTPLATGRSRESIPPGLCPPIRRGSRRRCWTPSVKRQGGACCATGLIPARQ